MIRNRLRVAETKSVRRRFGPLSGSPLVPVLGSFGFLLIHWAAPVLGFDTVSDPLPTVPWPETESAETAEGVAVLPVLRVSPDETLAVPICVANLREKPRVYWADWSENMYSVGWFPELVSLRTGQVYRRRVPPGAPAEKTRLTLLPARSATMSRIDLSSFYEAHGGAIEPGQYMLRVRIDVPENGALAMSGLKSGRASLPVAILEIRPRTTRTEAGFPLLPANWAWVPWMLVMGAIAGILLFLSRRLRVGRKTVLTAPSGG
ncbi:hypothetical protein JCM19992_32780 [Thermostilla marina]